MNSGYHEHIKNTVSLMVFLDGANFSNSSNNSYWGMFSTICELPPRVRSSYKNIITHFLIERSSPNLNRYLNKHSSELELLLNDGILIKDIGKLKIRILGLIADTPARSKILNTLAFNGKFGCIHCMHPGKTLSKGKVIYPYSITFPIRTKSLYEEQVQMSIHNKSIYKGIKGPCFFSKYLSVPDCVLIDVMHLTFGGIVKKMIDLWTNSCYHNKEWYLGKIKLILIKIFLYNWF